MDLDLEDDEEEATRCSSCMSACRRVTTFFLSHVGLISLVVGYCIIGAATFEALEKDHELKVIIQFVVDDGWKSVCLLLTT